MMKAPVNKIIPFSNVDGPGNRCAIFFQSCPFSCLYCHNPETITMCRNCGECIASCPTEALEMKEGNVRWNQKRCVNCDTCIRVCPHLSSPKIEWMSVADIMEVIVKKKAFLRGITVSGGECMNQADFLLELFREVKKLGLTCLIDSNGCHDFKQYTALMEVCDGVMLDVKAVDPIFHQQLCGRDNTIVLENLRYLLEIGKLEEVRTVILPKLESENEKTVRYVSEQIRNQSRYKLIRYRMYGVREKGLQFLGKENVTQEEVLPYLEICHKNGNETCFII